MIKHLLSNITKNPNWQLCLQENVSTLTILGEEKEGRKEVEDTEEENLPSALLQEKNQEIDHLNNEIQRLEQELENTKDNMVRTNTHRIHAVSVAVQDKMLSSLCLYIL